MRMPKYAYVVVDRQTFDDLTDRNCDDYLPPDYVGLFRSESDAMEEARQATAEDESGGEEFVCVCVELVSATEFRRSVVVTSGPVDV